MATYADMVQESTATTGTGTYDLGGARSGFQTFVAGVTTGATVTYCCSDGVDWEVGEGVVTDATPDTLTRATIIASSNADAAVNWATTNKNVSLVIPAGRSVIKDASGNLAGQTFSGDVSISHATDPALSVVDSTNTATTKLQSLDSSGNVGTTSAHDFIVKAHNSTAVTFDSAQKGTFAGDIATTGNAYRSVTATITASATQTQGQQALTTDINEISTVTTTDDVVTLPTAAAGLEIRIINNGANQLQIFPASGDAIDGGTVDASVILVAGGKVTYVAYNATNWESF